MEQNIIAICPSCGTKNRVPLDSPPSKRPVCGKCRSPLNVHQSLNRPVDITDTTFEREVLSYPGVVLVDCWAPWCGPCKMVAPVLEELAASYSGKAKIAKLNVDQNPLTASRFQVQSIPTLLFFKSGKLVDKVVGAVPKQELERRLSAIL